jgi:hypothetical protein
MPHKIVKGTVTIDGQVYKGFEMWAYGPWKVVKGTKHSDPSVTIGIKAKSSTAALKRWLATLEAPSPVADVQPEVEAEVPGDFSTYVTSRVKVERIEAKVPVGQRSNFYQTLPADYRITYQGPDIGNPGLYLVIAEKEIS